MSLFLSSRAPFCLHEQLFWIGPSNKKGRRPLFGLTWCWPSLSAWGSRASFLVHDRPRHQNGRAHFGDLLGLFTMYFLWKYNLVTNLSVFDLSVVLLWFLFRGPKARVAALRAASRHPFGVTVQNKVRRTLFLRAYKWSIHGPLICDTYLFILVIRGPSDRSEH